MATGNGAVSSSGSGNRDIILMCFKRVVAISRHMFVFFGQSKRALLRLQLKETAAIFFLFKTKPLPCVEEKPRTSCTVACLASSQSMKTGQSSVIRFIHFSIDRKIENRLFHFGCHSNRSLFHFIRSGYILKKQ